MNSVYNYFISEMNKWQYWDDINVVRAEDHEGNNYLILDTWADHDALISHIKEILQLDEISESLADWEVERAVGAEIVFSDEYTACTDCGCIIRISPDSPHYQPDYFLGDGFIVCSLCFEENGYIESYIEELINNPSKAISKGLVDESDIEKIGFSELDGEYESGLYDKQDSPYEIYEELLKKYRDILFYINNSNPFSIEFKVFVREELDVEDVS